MTIEKRLTTNLELRLTVKAELTTADCDLDSIIETLVKDIEKKADVEVPDYDLVDFRQEMYDEYIPDSIEEERWV